jgi:hypothetical protein
LFKPKGEKRWKAASGQAEADRLSLVSSAQVDYELALSPRTIANKHTADAPTCNCEAAAFCSLALPAPNSENTFGMPC